MLGLGSSLVARKVKNLPAVRETRVQSLGQEDPWEEDMATHSSILAWRIPGAEEPGELHFKGSQSVRHKWIHWACWALVAAHRVFDFHCGMWICVCVCVFQLWHVGSLVVTYELLVATCGIKFPEQGLNPGLLHWKLGVLATGPPGKSQLLADLADMDSTQRNQRGTPPAPHPCYTASLAFREEVTC